MALGVSGLVSVRQLSLTEHTNTLPVLVDLFREHRSMRLALAREVVFEQLPAWDLSTGMEGLPEAERNLIRELALFYDNLGALVTHGVVDIGPVSGYLGGSVISVWERMEPLVRAERAKRAQNALPDPNRWSLSGHALCNVVPSTWRPEQGRMRAVGRFRPCSHPRGSPSLSSALYRVCESLSDAPSALSRARAIMRDLADWNGFPWPQLELVTTAEQYVHAVRTFGAARVAGERALPGVGPFLDELRHRGVAFDRKELSSRFAWDLRLRPDLADLWPLPEGLVFTLAKTPPFGGPDSEPEDDCTEEELDRMVSVLGPLTMNVSWNCRWRGLPEFKDCGVQLCLNSVWAEQYAEPAPGEFGVWVSLGSRVAWTPAGEAWLRDSGLTLGEAQTGW